MKFVERKKVVRYASKGGLKFDEKNPKQRSRAQQQFAKEANINFIMSRYQKTGVLVDPLKMGTRRAMFGDFSDASDYRETKNQIIEAEREFLDLPAKVRAKFNNDPAELLAFVDDDANYDEALKLGLVDKRADVIVENNINVVENGITAPTE